MKEELVRRVFAVFEEDTEEDDYLIQEADAAWKQHQEQIYFGSMWPCWNETYAAFYLGYCLGRRKSPS